MVVISYLGTISLKEKVDFKEKLPFREMVLDLFRDLVDKGFQQLDPSWRHIGWYHNEQPRQLKLFDFGHVQSIEPEQKQEAFEMMVPLLDEETMDLCLKCHKYEYGCECSPPSWTWTCDGREPD